MARTEVLREIGHRKTFWKLTFQALGLFHSLQSILWSNLSFSKIFGIINVFIIIIIIIIIIIVHCSFDLNFFRVLVWAALPFSYCIFIFQEWTNKRYCCNYTNKPDNICFVSCGFLVHCYQTSLLTTLLPDNKNCVRILKGSYIVMKCSDNKVYETIWYLPSESARSTADKWLTLVLWHHYNVSH